MKSKKSIFDAFVNLRSKKELRKITVKELCEKALINKSTFYTYYEDMFDLSDKIESEVVDGIVSTINYPQMMIDEPVKFYRNLLGAMTENKALTNTVFSGSQHPNLIVKLSKSLKKMNNIELFNQIYEKYYKSIVSYFSRRFDNDEAEDLAQITFMKLWGYLPTLGYIKKEKSLIFKIAKNVLADRLRKNNFADSLDELESIKCLEVFDDITSVEIQQILLKMSEIDREIVTLKSYGWSSREIGKLKNLPSSTVRNRLAALKKQIKKELGEPCGRRKHHNTYKT